MHRFEAHITVQRVERERREAWEWWKARTKVSDEDDPCLIY